MARIYYKEPEDSNDDWGFFIILLLIIGLWWGIIHFIDWTTFNIIPWWLEPFTILLIIPYILLYINYGSNPLTWWPLVWGTKVNIDSDDFISLWRKEEACKKYGGPLNVYYNSDYIKFRRRRDAVTFCLLQKDF